MKNCLIMWRNRNCILLSMICYLILAVVLVGCSSGDQDSKENQLSTSENIIVSIIETFKKLRENALVKSGLEASVRSVFKKPITSAVYALSMLVGVVAMLAFYESPVSPMPVPPLPDPPVGRFPPEHPIWPPPSKDAVKFNDKKRIGSAQTYSPPLGSSQNLFPQVMTDSGYQKLLNLIENRNSKPTAKHQKYDTLDANLSPELASQMYPLFVPSDIQYKPPSNETLDNLFKVQTLYHIPMDDQRTDRHDSHDYANKMHYKTSVNYNTGLDKFKDLNNINRLPNLDLSKEKVDKLNQTSISIDSSALKKLKSKPGE